MKNYLESTYLKNNKMIKYFSVWLGIHDRQGFTKSIVINDSTGINLKRLERRICDGLSINQK